MTNAVIYTRVSWRPNADESQSIDAQLAWCRGHCMFRDLTVVGTHEDRAVSGKRIDNRPGMQRAIKQTCGLGRDGVLVVYSLSRAFRSVIDALEVIGRLEKAGCGFISANESIDTTTPGGRCYFTIVAAMSQMEREQVSERTRNALRYMQDNGQRVSSRLPFGQMEDPTSPLGKARPPLNRRHTGTMPCPEEQVLLRRMRGMFGRGMRARAICSRMEEEGVLFRGGAKWHVKTVHRIIQRFGS